MRSKSEKTGDKKKVTFFISESKWLWYKSECTVRKLVPSDEIEKFMKEQIDKWNDKHSEKKD